jgi:D-alanyl-D-alanine carboxypeptidase
MADLIQIRRDTAANWASVNPILGQGEMGFVTDTKLLKTGDGSTAWNAILYDKFVETVGSIAGNALDLSTGTVFSSAPASNATYVFSNPPASGIAYGFTLKITPSGTVTVTWPASVYWAGGTAPDAPASGATNVYSFYTQDGGTTYFGFLAGAAMA